MECQGGHPSLPNKHRRVRGKAAAPVTSTTGFVNNVSCLPSWCRCCCRRRPLGAYEMVLRQIENDGSSSSSSSSSSSDNDSDVEADVPVGDRSIRGPDMFSAFNKRRRQRRDGKKRSRAARRNEFDDADVDDHRVATLRLLTGAKSMVLSVMLVCIPLILIRSVLFLYRPLFKQNLSRES